MGFQRCLKESRTAAVSW